MITDVAVEYCLDSRVPMSILSNERLESIL